MFLPIVQIRKAVGARCSATLLLLAVLGAGMSAECNALPLFARQTGQNCLSCHAGGQFPELTPYGRKFKLTGYTMGERAAVPLAVMGVASSSKVVSTAGSTDVEADYPHNGRFEFTTASVLCCGKVTDNFGTFIQWTWERLSTLNAEGSWVSHSHVDQVDLRYADRFISKDRDLIVGASLNNNPGVTDVWNTHNSAFTPVPSYVPVSNPSGMFTDVQAMPIVQSLGQDVAGVNAYAFLNNFVYAEVGWYKAAEKAFSLLGELRASDMDSFRRLKGLNPYWRLALNHDWGANSAMVGIHGMTANTYFDAADTTSPTAHYKDFGVDGQYQYILDPHVVTAMFSYTHEKQSYADELWNPANPNPLGAFANAGNTLDYYRAKLTYVYQATYGASLAYSEVRGSADSIAYANPSGVPNSRLWVPEIFWNPVQYVRVGLQYFKWDRYLGEKRDYDGNGRNARDNNTVFLYVWGAY